jgi:Methyltransferase domain
VKLFDSAPGALIATGRSLRDLAILHRVRSPIPLLSPDLVAALGSEDIVLPPPAWITQGSLDLQSLVMLLMIARSIRPRSVLEIGTATGVTSLALTLNSPDAKVFTLDLADNQQPTLPVGGNDHPLRTSTVSRVYLQHPAGQHVVQLVGDSATFDFRALNQEFDLIFVDGAHSLSYMEADSKTAFELVSEDGVVVWDDYWSRTPEVVSYLDGRTDLRLFRLPGTRLVCWFSDLAFEAITEPRA